MPCPNNYYRDVLPGWDRDAHSETSRRGHMLPKVDPGKVTGGMILFRLALINQAELQRFPPSQTSKWEVEYQDIGVTLRAMQRAPECHWISVCARPCNVYNGDISEIPVAISSAWDWTSWIFNQRAWLPWWFDWPNRSGNPIWTLDHCMMHTSWVYKQRWLDRLGAARRIRPTEIPTKREFNSTV